MAYLDRLISGTKKSIPGYHKPDTFNYSTLRFEVNSPTIGIEANSATISIDNRGNPIYTKEILEIVAVLYKKPRINKVVQQLDRVQCYEVYEGNVINPQSFVLGQQQVSEGEITGTAIINGVFGKARLVSIGKGYLKAYNELIGRLIQVEFIGSGINT